MNKEGRWSSDPDKDGNIEIPDELDQLYHKLGMQLRMHTISGKNEIQTIADMVWIADKFFDQKNKSRIRTRGVQVVRYKCCGEIFAACTEPECYTESDWQKNLREYAKRGEIIEIVESGSVRMSKCKCEKKETDSEQSQQIKLPI